MILLITVAFISGLLTILSPCLWPILPVILTSPLSQKRGMNLFLVAGIIISFNISTLFLSFLIKLTRIKAEFFQTTAIVILISAGLSLVIPQLAIVWERLINPLPRGLFIKKEEENFAPFLIGLALGLLWTPCSGPILLTMATLAATRVVSLQTVLITSSYSLGVGLPLLTLLRGEQWLINKGRLLTKWGVFARKAAGLIMILYAFLILTNYDKTLQLTILKRFPFSNSIFIRLEQNPKIKKKLEKFRQQRDISAWPSATREVFNLTPSPIPSLNPITRFPLKQTPSPTGYKANLANLGKAPEIQGIVKWFNIKKDEPKTLAELKGKVVLIDFWAYTCSWCLPTIEYKNQWLDKYKNQGFVVIGIHVPATTEAKSLDKIEKAIQQYKIKYPVGVDNDFKTWDAYKNQYIPGEYLIDRQGFIRYTHFEAGDYDKTEKAILELLKEE